MTDRHPHCLYLVKVWTDNGNNSTSLSLIMFNSPHVSQRCCGTTLISLQTCTYLFIPSFGSQVMRCCHNLDWCYIGKTSINSDQAAKKDHKTSARKSTTLLLMMSWLSQISFKNTFLTTKSAKFDNTGKCGKVFSKQMQSFVSTFPQCLYLMHESEVIHNDVYRIAGNFCGIKFSWLS